MTPPQAPGAAVGGRRHWMPAEDRKLARLYATLSAAECAAKLDRTTSSVQQRVAILGLAKSPEWVAERTRQRWAEGRHEGSRRAHFPRGEAAWNKGRPMAEWNPNAEACRATQFKKGDRRGAAQRNWVPLGTRKVRDGLLCVKVTDDPNVYPAARWQPVSRLVWEAANGPIPSGSLVVFKPGKAATTEEEITLDRLELVTRAENMRRNSYHTRYPKEVAQLIQLRGALNRKINRRSKGAE